MNQSASVRPALMAGILSVILPVGNAMAAHSDIDIEDVIGGQIVLHTEAQPIDHATGYIIFEAEFGEVALLPHETDDPGFASESPGPLGPGNMLMYQTRGTLSYWNGTSWSAADANTSLHVAGNFFEDSRYTSAGLSGNAFGLLQQVGSDGGIHTHVDFCVENLGLSSCPASPGDIFGNSPATGAYLVEMSLFETDSYDGSLIGSVVSSSDPFFLAFNNGLSEADFDAGIEALTAVPVPAAVWLFGSGLLGLIGMGRQRLGARQIFSD